MLNSWNVLRTLLRDSLEPAATLLLALKQDNAPYWYGMGFNRNVPEVFDAHGTIMAAYDYSFYGTVTGTGDLAQASAGGPERWAMKNWPSFITLSIL